MLKWKILEKVLPLKFNWNISRNLSFEKKNFFIQVSDFNNYGIGEVAPNIRYNENEELIKNQFEKFIEISSNIKNIDELNNILNSIKLCNSLRFGIESSFIHYLCQKNKILPYKFLKLKRPNYINTSFSIPIMELDNIENFIKINNLKRFSSLKIKVNSENAIDMISFISKLTNQKLRIDANEAWKDVDELIKFTEKIKKFNIEFIEQPMPASMKEEYFYYKKHCPFDLIADESIENEGDFEYLSKAFTGINVKLMKAGGYFNAIKLLNKARKSNLKTMLGCMIETSLGIYSAFNISNNIDYIDLDGFLIIKEDTFNLVYENEGKLFVNKEQELLEYF
ncbi:MAG: muconate cycloisomerase [Candidatus Sericytochromatia bacterium]|nr:MAG: muconate cycloisomerase [Candidatus Sericytochromatia bacterium]